jgi:hypothetical protein
MAERIFKEEFSREEYVASIVCSLEIHPEGSWLELEPISK